MTRAAESAVSERSILAVVGLGGMLIPLNSTMLAVALPRLTDDLHASVAQTGWLVTAYLIAMAALQPVGGKLGDRYGRRPFLVGGVAAFAAASAGAALSRTIWALIVFRVAQAIAGAIFFPNGGALVREVVAAERRGMHFGVMGSAIGFGAAAGPTLGGLLVDAGGWPAIFWVNIPLAAGVFVAGWRVVPPRQGRHSGERFDLVGAALLAAVLGATAWLLTHLRDATSVVRIALACGIVVGGALFLSRELRHPDPILQPRFFTRRVFAAATGGIALSNLSLYVLLLVVPLLLQPRPGWSESRIGFALTSMSIGMVVFAPFGGRLGDRFGRRPPAVAGLAFLAAGSTVIAIGGPEVAAPVLIGGLLASGMGLGLSSASLQTAAVESIEREHAGMATGANSTARYLGSVVGTSILAGVLASGDGFQILLVLVAAAAIASAGLAMGLPRRAAPTHLVIEPGVP